jgi:hypothetical protein
MKAMPWVTISLTQTIEVASRRADLAPFGGCAQVGGL